ncbi:hypothetical protein AB0A05_26850 [Streptomyces sp. NPDC046374]|uniref:hypothetical protein n=1 Tax=Streptomyces sp. NPDC046374 TaxID=3154917 RepID=UPI0033D1E516
MTTYALPVLEIEPTGLFAATVTVMTPQDTVACTETVATGQEIIDRLARVAGRPGFTEPAQMGLTVFLAFEGHNGLTVVWTYTAVPVV